MDHYKEVRTILTITLHQLTIMSKKLMCYALYAVQWESNSSLSKSQCYFSEFSYLFQVPVPKVIIYAS